MFSVPEMLAFQQVPANSPSSAELSARVARWTSLTVWREPLDVLSFLCFLFAFSGLKRSTGSADAS
jgi:hypothetical protein